ncbi:MAG: quinone-dependent dihydroorotate dehydrogenase [Flavobacteriaceae bacterium]
MYRYLIKPILFLCDPEWIHHFVFAFICWIHKIPGVPFLVRAVYQVEHPKLEKEFFGIRFKNPVGLAAGFDKDAKLYRELSNFGFGFVEIGTLTPKPQTGNPKKRLFRIPHDGALINRMGFNNQGVKAAIPRLQKNKNIIIGGNIGKNKNTPNNKATDDYIYCFQSLYPHVDYFVVNVSSPNTPNLRELQEKKPLTELLNTLQKINQATEKPKPILLKISPDLNDDQLIDIIDIVKTTHTAGVIATNTTLSRDGLSSSKLTQTGGLSGKPLTQRSTDVVRFLSEKSKKAFLIIGVGGIHDPKDAIEKINAGADLIQLYTGFVYNGPAVVKRINKALINE